MTWKEIDEKLIKRGELILDLDFLEHHQQELEAANQFIERLHARKEGVSALPLIQKRLSRS
jgi:hypothetical protein